MGEFNKKDVILEDNMKDGDTTYRENNAKEHVVSTKTSNNDINYSTKGIAGSTKDSSKVFVHVSIKSYQNM